MFIMWYIICAPLIGEMFFRKLFEIDKWLIIWDNYNRGDVYEVWWCFSKYSGYIGKEFKIDTRGYRPQEVDSFLDVIMRDYNEYNNIIKALVKDNKSLMAENHTLKEEVRNLKSSIEAAKYGEKEITNVDLLRRISQLEKIILGKEEK